MISCVGEYVNMHAFVQKMISNETLFRKKRYFHAFCLDTYRIYSNRLYGFDALQIRSIEIKSKVDWMLHGSQKHSAHTKTQRFEWLTQPRCLVVS